jgi:hypothetical protein
MEALPRAALDSILGGTDDATPTWDDIRRDAEPYCPNTVAANLTAPTDRAQAQLVGDACLREMGRVKAFLGRKRIQAGINKAFPEPPGSP